MFYYKKKLFNTNKIINYVWRDCKCIVHEIDIKLFNHYFDGSYNYWEHDTNILTLDKLGYKGKKAHLVRIKCADLDYPIIILKSKKRRIIIVDGCHRLVKCFIEGRKSVECVYITEEELFKLG